MGCCNFYKMILKKFCIFFLFTLLILLVPAKGFSQKGIVFSGDSVKFMGELDLVFQNLTGNEADMSKTLMQSFIQKWNAEKYSPAQKQMIYAVGNVMLKKKMRSFPDFYNYISSLNAFKETHQPEEGLYEWFGILKKMGDNKNSRLMGQFLETSFHFFAEKSIYHSYSTRWKMVDPVYHFRYDSVPVIDFSTSDLICYANDDSLLIFGTKGSYFPLTSQWFGIGGGVNWRRAGIDKNLVYANLATYEIQLKFSRFTADSVEFFHKKYFNYPVIGTYNDKILADVTEEKASYPRFFSYDKQIGIKDLFKNVDYLGGFALEGSKIIGSGDETYDAMLAFKKDGKEFARVSSRLYVIRPDRISSSLASISIYHEEDSIYHPGLQMKYNDLQKELTLSRDERLAYMSPWYDSWHQIEIYCETLSWKLNESRIDFGMMKGPVQEGKAIFESTNYYSQQRYERIQGIDDENPLNIIKRYCEQKNTRVFTLQDITQYMKKPMDQVESQLLALAYKGFLLYNINTKKATAKEKLLNYVQARNGKMDYDVIFFNSKVSGKSNGILGLDSFELRIQGVPSVFLSDSQQVHIYPSRAEVILTKGGDFLFSGKVEAGLFDMYGKNFSFSYHNFKLNLPDIDSMGFYVHSRTKDPKTQQFPLVKIKTYLNDLTGDLLIDDPGNKSGLKNFPQYPIFTSKREANVNWDKKNILKGVYKKQDFYYSLLPFQFKSIGELPTDSLTFRGHLTSAGIFPDITQQLVVRPDYSLGIETTTDARGLPVYGDKGVFTSHIEMSDAGLRGNGKLVFLNSTSLSDNFIFFPDSMKAFVKSFIATEVLAAIEYPAVKADSVQEFWLPQRDSLLISSIKKEMNMYNDQSRFAGQLALTPSGMTGEGTVKIRDAEMDSRRFKFNRRAFDANIANFRIKSYDLADLTISTRNYQTHFDFDMRRGEFKSNVGISKVEFPVNKYTCSMDRFDWLIDNEEIALFNDRKQQKARTDTLSLDKLIDMEYTGSEFISVHPAQDSLTFFAMKARYNLRQNIINAEEVTLIKVADAAIYPDSGKVRIMKDAVMLPLKRAGIIANTTSKFHHFYNADVSIASRKNYTANGYYDYVERGGNRQQIYFHGIKVDSSLTTIATGTITDSASFRLSPDFYFRGEIRLRSSDRLLTFDGGFRPITDCFQSLISWAAFKSMVDPQLVVLPLDQPLRDMNVQKLNLGIYYSNADNRIFASFFKRKESFSDSVLVSAQGFIDYSPPQEAFRVMPPERRKDPNSTQNLLTLTTGNCVLHGEGKINLGMNPGPMKMETYGSMDYYVIPDSVSARGAIALDFPFSADALQKLSQQLIAINLPGLIFSTSPYNLAIRNILGNKEFDKVKAEMEMTGKFRKFPQELIRTLFLADVKLKWDSVNKAWISYGTIGIGNVGNGQVNRYVNGTIEFSKKRNGDDFTVYLELTKDDWYFFNYRNNILQALSSNLEFNDLVTKTMQTKSEQKRVDDLAKGYRYTISTERKKRDFLRRFESSGEE